ncbi:glycerophosphodiester phosphodiesterase [Oceanithermus sp.]
MDRTLIIAHRGARSLAPENTLAAAQKGLEAGADLWETDVGVTADGVLILFHDDSLKRTTNAPEVYPGRAPWTFTEFTFAEIECLDAGSWFDREDPFGQIAAGRVSAADQAAYRGIKVPTLEEALAFTRDHDWVINVELKRLPPPLEDFPVVPRFFEVMDRVGIAPEQVRLSSFRHHWLEEARALRPEVEVQALVGYHRDRPINWEAVADYQTINARATLTPPDKVRELVRAGKKINLFTVNDPHEAKSYIEAGVSGLFTDFPQDLAPLVRGGKEKA